MVNQQTSVDEPHKYLSLEPTGVPNGHPELRSAHGLLMPIRF